MTTLLTGASGFIGSALARKLVALGEPVRAIVRKDSDQRNLEGLPIEIVEADLVDPESLAHAVEGCEALFHVAADYRLWVPRPDKMYATNVEGTRNLVRAATRAGVRRIVYTSSVAVLGAAINGVPADESQSSTLADMIGHYKRSKFMAEEAVRTLVREEGAPVVVVNPSTPIGPRDIKPTPTGRLVIEAAAGRMPAYVNTGLNVVHVDDVAEGHLLAFERGQIGERYILGGANMTLREILCEIAGVAGQRPPTLRLPTELVFPIAVGAELQSRLFGGVPRVTVSGVRMARKKMYFSSEKASRELGYRARPVREAISDAVAWFREHGYLA